ncbi:MAG: T9SS type A sorting domain-containing protein, partial [Bacteroidota bacterium]|nr:T9SS type A sorting domain-containing protein [Bacteroidota bacterium]
VVLHDSVPSGAFVQSNTVNGHFYFSMYSTTEFSIGNDTLFYIKLYTNGGTSLLTWDTQVQGSCEFADIGGNVINSEYSNGAVNSYGTVPYIDNQPQDQTVYVGDAVVFQRPGPASFTYQWFVSVDSGLVWQDISNYTYIYADGSDNLKIDICQELMSGFLFKCLVTGTCPPDIESDIALLEVIPVPLPPQEIEVFVGSVTSCPDTVLIPVTVNGFYDVASISLGIDFDPAVLTFDTVDSLHLIFNNGSHTFNSFNGKFLFSWYSISNTSIVSDTLFFIRFVTNGGSSTLDWDTQTNGICEFSDLNGDVIASVYQDGDVFSGGFVSVITEQPQDSTVIENNNVSFSVTVPGPSPTYIWQQSTNQGMNWDNLPASSAMLSFLADSLNMDGNWYRCIVSGTCPPADTSEVAILYVHPAPPPPQEITASLPVITNSCTGNLHIPIVVDEFENVGAMSLAINYDTASFVFNGIADINGGLSQNYLVVNDIDGKILISWFDTYGITFAGTDTLFNLEFVSQGGSSALTWDLQTQGLCEFTDPNGSVIQSYFVNASVSVVSNPLLIDAGVNDTIAVFDSTMLDVLVSGGLSPYTFYWYPDDSLSNQFIVNPLADPLSTSTYYIQVSDNNNCQAEDFMQVVVIGTPCPVIQTQPLSQTLCEGEDAIFTVEASGIQLSYQWQFNAVDIVGATSDTLIVFSLDLLDEGNYNCIVTNPYCIESTITVSLNVSPLPIVSLTGLASQYCLNAEMDTLVGVPAFGTFSGNGIIGQFFLASDAGVGTYEIVYTYTENNCTNSTSLFTEVLGIPQLSFQITDIACFGDSTGQIDLSVSGGNPPLSFSWSDGVTSEDRINIHAGNYSVAVTDNNACIVCDTAVVAQNPEIQSVFSSYMVSVFGGNDGAATISPSGGVPPYSYLWMNGATTDSISNLSAGEYFVTITDILGCTLNESVVVYQPGNIQLFVTDVTCNGFGDAEIEVIIVGGFPPFDYIWSTGATVSHITNLDIGTYIVSVTDAQNVVHIDTANVSQPNILELNPILQDVSCHAWSDGAIDITVFGGTPPYFFIWSNGATTEDIDSLVSGNYSITVTDLNACEIVGSYAISQPALPISIAMTIVNVSCNAYSDGNVATTVTGGTTPYSYNWSNGTTLENVSGLSAGNYYLNIEDANGCINNDPFQITQPAELIVNTITTSTSCFDSINGSACVDISGGTSPYSVLWDNQANSNCIQYLASGNYIVTVVDNNGCTQIETAIVGGAAEIILNESISHLTQPGANDGNIGLNVTGGIMPYNYNWGTGNTTDFVDSLVPGYYNLILTDSNLCEVENSFLIMTYNTQTINLVQNWGIYSTYIIPPNQDVSIVGNPVISNLEIVKDENGNVFWPQFGLNAIGDIILGEGYQVKMSNADTLLVSGLYKEPELHPIDLPYGWSMIGYLRTTPADVAAMFSYIVSEIAIVKNGDGQVYWPVYSVNTIGNMNPGEGYQIKMNSAQTFTYPANSANLTKSNIEIKHPRHFKNILPTGNNMTLGIMHNGLNVKPGDEIAVFGKSGLLVGAAVAGGDFTAITIWGNDELTDKTDGLLPGEEFEIRIMDTETNQEQLLIVEEWIDGDGSYEINKIAIAKINHSSIINNHSFELYQNIPNPFTGETEISFYLPYECDVELEIFNVTGSQVEKIHEFSLPDATLQPGKHTIKISSKTLTPGTYYYRLRTADFEDTKKMVVIKP